MKLVTFSFDGHLGAGVFDEDIAICAEGDAAAHAVLDVIRQGDEGLAAWRRRAQDGRRVSLQEVKLLAPIPEPRSAIYCVGKNYHAHAAEFHSSGFDSGGKEEVPKNPVIFTKAATSVIGPGDTVRASLDPTATVDYEGELALVIGRRAFQVSAAEAYDHVAGYMILNDVTSRELQRKHSQWVIGKGLDTFCPMGPWLVTADEVGDVTALELETRVNGETRQKASVRDLIFDIPTLIETMTATMTLMPGDIIATGTPAGVGIGFKPPRYLQSGDSVSVEITGLGRLENPIG